MEGDRQPDLVVKSGFEVVDQPSFSPDGRWIAYNSDDCGRHEVYLTPFPATGARWQVSSAGGVQPLWNRTGRELYFLAPDGTVMAVDVSLGATPVIGAARALFASEVPPSSNVDTYAVTPDGQRFLMMVPVRGQSEPAPRVILDWPALLDGTARQMHTPR